MGGMLDRTGEQWAERLRVEGDKRTLARIIARLREEAAKWRAIGESRETTHTVRVDALSRGHALNGIADTLEREGAK
jgi:hypothetical protein